MKRKRRIETSKKVLFVGYAFGIISGLAVIIGWFKGLESAPILFTAILAFLTFKTKYYMRKAGEENVIKLQRTNRYTDAQIDKLLAFADRSTGQNIDQNPQG